MAKVTKTQDAPAEGVNSWAESRDRFPDDRRLRRAGFKIVARPKNAEATWRLGDRVMTHSQALKYLGLYARPGLPVPLDGAPPTDDYGSNLIDSPPGDDPD